MDIVLQLIVVIVLLFAVYGALVALVSFIQDWVEEVRFKRALKRGDVKITFVIFEEDEDEEVQT